MNSASMTVFPVTAIDASGTLSLSSACARGLGRGEMQRHQRRRQPAVGFFRKRRPDVAGPEPRLDVADRDAPVEAGQRRHQDRGRVSLHERHVGMRRGEPSVDAGHQPRRQLGQRLIGTHHVELGIHRDAEPIDDLAEHLLVLPGRDDRAREIAGVPERRDHRGQLDGLRAGAHEDQNALLAQDESSSAGPFSAVRVRRADSPRAAPPRSRGGRAR